MIIFGFSSSPREGDALSSPCSHCQQSAQVALRSFNYFHLFFLPVIPLGSKQGVSCTHCQKTLWGRDARAIIEAGAADDSDLPGRPFWHFVGPVAAAALIALVLLSGPSDRSIRAAEAAAAPSVGDVWIVNMEGAIPDIEIELTYGVGRVDEITEDGVYLGFSDWQYDSFLQALTASRKAAAGRDDEYFTTAGVWFSRDEIITFENAHDFIWAFSAEELKEGAKAG